jgi:hypothetical protein
METIYFSKNDKLNKVLNNIYASLLRISDTEQESVEEVKHYARSFPNEPDFCLYQHGNVLVSNTDIRNLYADYKALQNCSDDKIITIYKRQIGYVARHIITNS